MLPLCPCWWCVGGVRDSAAATQEASEQTNDVDDTISSHQCLPASAAPIAWLLYNMVEESIDGSSPLEESPASPMDSNNGVGDDDEEANQDPPSPFFRGVGDDDR